MPPNTQESLKGRLLLADPSISGGIFYHSVVLLTDHDSKDGAHGFILNQPTGKLVGDLLRTEEFKPLKKIPIYAGGPVAENQLTFSSFWMTPKRGLRWAIQISPDEAVQHSKRPGRIVRAFLGYSGWAAGQLEGELRQVSWHLASPPSDLLGQNHHEALWNETLANLSPYHRILTNSPRDPSLN